MFILVLTAISYGESIIDRPRLPTPPVPIAISSSESPLLSFAPVRWMDTANFINVKAGVCYSFSKHNIFSTKAIESFIVVWYRRRDLSRKPATCFFDSTFKNSLTLASNTKTMQMAREEVAEVSYCYYSRDSREIIRKFPCLEAAKFTDRDRTFWDVLPAAPRGRFRTLCPAKGKLFMSSTTLCHMSFSVLNCRCCLKCFAYRCYFRVKEIRAFLCSVQKQDL